MLLKIGHDLPETFLIGRFPGKLTCSERKSVEQALALSVASMGVIAILRGPIMRSLAFAALLILAVITTMLTVIAFASPEGDDAFLGRWDITATGSKSGQQRFCWLELRRDEGVLKGRFNAGGGAVFDLPQVAIENGELKFQYPQGKPPKETQQIWKATVKSAGLVGTALVNGQTLSVDRRARAGLACDSAREKARQAYRPLQW